MSKKGSPVRKIQSTAYSPFKTSSYGVEDSLNEFELDSNYLKEDRKDLKVKA